MNPDALFAISMSQFLGFPFAIIFLIILAMQLASTSVASEKEEKTLEEDDNTVTKTEIVEDKEEAEIPESMKKYKDAMDRLFPTKK